MAKHKQHTCRCESYKFPHKAGGGRCQTKHDPAMVKSEDLDKVAPPGFSEAAMHKLKAKYGVESAFKIAWAAHNKKMKKSEALVKGPALSPWQHAETPDNEPSVGSLLAQAKKGPPPIPEDADYNKKTYEGVKGEPSVAGIINSLKPNELKPQANAPTLWMNKYPVSSKDHIEELEQNAAIGQFHGGLPKEKAEAQAHKEYVQRERMKAAAHHLAGMKAAHIAGDLQTAKKHSDMYGHHMKALGHKEIGEPPASITGMANKEPFKMRFRPHKGDMFAMDTAVSSAPNPAVEGNDK